MNEKRNKVSEFVKKHKTKIIAGCTIIGAFAVGCCVTKAIDSAWMKDKVVFSVGEGENPELALKQYREFFNGRKVINGGFIDSEASKDKLKQAALMIEDMFPDDQKLGFIIEIYK